MSSIVDYIYKESNIDKDKIRYIIDCFKQMEIDILTSNIKEIKTIEELNKINPTVFIPNFGYFSLIRNKRILNKINKHDS